MTLVMRKVGEDGEGIYDKLDPVYQKVARLHDQEIYSWDPAGPCLIILIYSMELY